MTVGFSPISVKLHIIYLYTVKNLVDIGVTGQSFF